VLFNRLDFAVFLVGTWLVWRGIHRHRLARLWWLLVASAFFYGCWRPWYLLLVAVSIGLQYGVGRLLVATGDPVRRRWLCAAGVAGDLSLLAVFKYGNFLAESIEGVAAWAGLHLSVPRVPAELPVGISFYTFQSLSYTIDLYRRRIPPARSLLDFAVYVLFFPQLVAGPIVRASEFLPQLDRPPATAPRDIGAGVFLILAGLAKKMILADTLATWVVAPFFASPGGHHAVEALGALWAANFQVYCDFSGYSDVACGAALLFGYTLPVNFDRPFWSQTPMEHWRRWHITLSSWLRDYLYFPLGGNQKGPARTDLNLIITFLLGGLWHGAGWTFVVWGLYNGVLLAAWRRWGPGPTDGRIGRWARQLLTFHAICLGLVFLHAHSFADAATVFWNAGRWRGGFTGVFPVAGGVALAAALALHTTPQRWKLALQDAFAEAPAWGVGAAVVVGGAVLSLFAGMASPFFYFQF
jgi:D-alanyl-lipoteichoic acid acyltransferase DltB (MBOAT superfamily)